MTAWKTTKTAKTCNTFPHVWAAIVGCTGKGSAWRYTTSHFGRRDVEYACPICRAAQERLEALSTPAHQDALRALQDAAGVADYRVAEVAWLGGRPVLTGKVDVNLAHEAADYALREMTNGEDVARAARALVVYHAAGGVCRSLVASHRIPSRQLAALRNAFRAWTRESSPTGHAATL